MTPPGGLIRAAGGVLWRPAGTGARLALVHRPRYDDWSLPKGKLDPGETFLEAAVREVHEETGQHGHPGRRLPEIHYRALAGPKVVRYWVMRLTGEGAAGIDRADSEQADFVPGDEVDGLDWVSPETAEERLTYPHDVDVVRDFARVRADSLVLLVRHASAGDRYAWVGPDEERPLDGTGQAQTATLTRVLALFGPTRVLTADRVRCVQTVEPLAARLGLPLLVEPAFSEESYAEDSARALRRIRELAGAGAVSVVCAQGGGIPDLVATLGSEDGVEVPRPRSRKGSVWALSFRDGALLAADYYRDFDPPPAA
jgi:8-oxo-(d)GTP phosphatase